MPAPSRLRDLSIKAISLTKRGASEGAHVLVAKHHLAVASPPAPVLDVVRGFLRSAIAKLHSPAAARDLTPAQLDALAESLAADEADALAKHDEEVEEDEDEDEEEGDEEDVEYEEDEDEEEDEEEGDEEAPDAKVKAAQDKKMKGGFSLGKTAPNTPHPEIGMADTPNKAAQSAEEVLKSMPVEARGAIELLMKSAIDAAVAPLTQRAEAAEKAAKDAQDKATALSTEIALNKATGETVALLKGVPHDGALMTSLLQKATPEERGAVEQIAKAYRALDERSTAITKSLGGRAVLTVEDGSPESKLDTLAKAIAKEEKVTFEKAYVLATERNPDLYNEIVARDTPVRGEA